MQHLKWYIVLVLFIFSLLACSKAPSVNQSGNQPVFKFVGTVGNDSINLQAGVNRVYMFTDYFKDSQNLWTLAGTFAPDTCSTCEPYLSFNLKDVETTNGSTLAKDYSELFKNQVFNSYSIDSILTTTPTEIFEFSSYSNNPSTTQYLWDFGDGTTSTLSNPTHIFPILGERVVRLLTTYNNFTDTIENTIDCSLNSTCRVQFTTSGSTDSLNCNGPAGFLSYLWNFGNGTVSTSQTPIVNFPQPGIYTVSLNATQQGCNNTMSFKQKVPVQQVLGSYCLSNYNYIASQSTTTTFQPRINKSAFIVTYKKNGQTYYSYKRSKSVNQSNTPIFTMSDFNLYVPNEKNQSTVYVTGSLDTWLYNSANTADSIHMVSSDLKFALAFPR